MQYLDHLLECPIGIIESGKPRVQSSEMGCVITKKKMLSIRWFLSQKIKEQKP